jgi:RNA polymerase sigma-70 factor (ECF subfamily)
VQSWRAELLARAWQALERFEQESRRPFYQALRLRVESPDLSRPQLAEQLAARLGKPVTPAAYRQTLCRARKAFGGFLVEEVAHSLLDPSPEAIERELADLGLLEYCRSALRPD